MMKSYSRNTFPPVQEILVHLFKKYLSTCLLADCPLEPIPQQCHPKQAPFQKRVFYFFSNAFVNVQLTENRMCSNIIFKFSSIFWSIQRKRIMSICQFVKPPRRPQKCQVFLLLHEAPKINKLEDQNKQNNVNECIKTFPWFLCLLYSQPSYIYELEKQRETKTYTIVDFIAMMDVFSP